ncbi:MAG: hypothetical protein QG608_1665 [Actinomycetota bacterium]|nr:hypothetical protein [Actinomycetota bacterium]
MTVGTAATPVSASMVLALVDEARSPRFRYPSGIIGVRGVPDRTLTADLTHEGQKVRVRPAPSALAAREILAEHQEGDWLVVVTDRDDDDLGAGLLAHFVWQRLRSPDPWEAVRGRFAATGIDPALTLQPAGRDLAAALLAATPPGGWPAAPAGVLTRAHALGSVACTHLGFDTRSTDVLGVLRWSMTADSVEALAALRSGVADLLADATLDWIAQRAGTACAPVRALLARGELADVVPVGIVLDLLTGENLRSGLHAHRAQLALARLEEQRWGGTAPTTPALAALGRAATALLSDLVHDRRADAEIRRVLDRADAIIERVRAEPLVAGSDFLACGLRARFVALAEALRRAVAPGTVPVPAAVPAPVPEDSAVDAVEAAWANVTAHRFAPFSPLRGPFEAAVRLVRRLALPDSVLGPGPRLVPVPDQAEAGARLGALARRYADHDAWVDTAIDDAFVGVDDPDLSPALQSVVAAAQQRRRRAERAFAAALAAAAPTASGDGVAGDAGTVWYMERLLPGAIIPLARKAPVLLLVLDGMSAATATQILTDVTTRLGWVEAALPGSNGHRRAAALAVLPSLTEVSRASLLCGRLTRGKQNVEQDGYHELTAQVGKITAELFHKKSVDTTAAGWSVSHEVGEAIDDTRRSRLVTVVLNTIDDALDRSDPAGTTWTADAVKHLEPLLARAAAGRTVVMTADHGHVVERRQGTPRTHPDATSARSRSAGGGVEDGEVEVSGPRVLAEGNRAVLAVDDTLRYGPLKAGYHGGACAAEVVVPVAVLLLDETANTAGLALLPPQVPSWWLTPHTTAAGAATGSVTGTAAVFVTGTATGIATGSAIDTATGPAARAAGPVTGTPARAAAKPGRTPGESESTLFDLEQTAPAEPAAKPAVPADKPPAQPPAPAGEPAAATLGRTVVTSRVYRSQRRVSGRLGVKDNQIAALVDALATANATRLPPVQVAQALGVGRTQLRGALSQVRQLLNVEGYAVLVEDAATGVVILDTGLLCEQFEVQA